MYYYLCEIKQQHNSSEEIMECIEIRFTLIRFRHCAAADGDAASMKPMQSMMMMMMMIE